MKASSSMFGLGLMTLCLVALPNGILSAHSPVETESRVTDETLREGSYTRTPPQVYWSITDSPFFIDVVASQEESTEAEIDELLETCDSSQNVALDEQCLEQLTAFFKDEPIWNSSRMEYFDHFRGPNLAKISYFNLRTQRLKYEYSDYLRHTPPTWGDVFDGNSFDRQEIVWDVINDETCTELASHDGIRPELSGRCKAHDLFKWTTFVEACGRGMQHWVFLQSAVPSPDYRHLTNFEHSIEEIDQKMLDPDKRKRTLKFQKKSYLLVVWLKTLCTGVSLQILPPEIGLGFESGDLNSNDLREYKRETHDLALRIAAKAGSSWAQTNYYPQNESSGYWQDLYDEMPILVHRYMGAGYGIGRRLSDEDRVRHAVQAQRLLEGRYPDLEIDEDWYRRDLGFAYAQQLQWDWLLHADLGNLKMPWEETIDSSGD